MDHGIASAIPLNGVAGAIPLDGARQAKHECPPRPTPVELPTIKTRCLLRAVP